MSLTTSAYQAMLKNLFHRGRVVDMVGRNQPFLAMVPKRTDFYGEDQKVTVKYANPGGASLTFSKAQSPDGSGDPESGKQVRFAVTRVSEYGVAHLDDEVIEASENNVGALAAALNFEISGKLNNVSYALGKAMFGNGGMSRGQVSSTSTTTLTLTDARDTRFFEVGMELEAGTTDGSSSGTKRSGNATITGIDRDAGTLTTDSNWTSQITSLGANDYLFRAGDTNSSNVGLGLKGLEAWLPSSAPSGGDSFFGVDRSIDTTRLAGIRHNGSQETIEDALTLAAADILEAGGNPSHVFLSPRTFANLKISASTAVSFVKNGVRGSGDFARLSFNSMELATGAGNVSIIADRNCTDNVAYMLDLSSWTFHTLKDAPRIVMTDGNRMLRRSSSDGVEFRVVARGNLYTNAPGHNARISLAS